MEILFPILGTAFLIWIVSYSLRQRTKITKRCPHCGTISNASAFSPRLQHSDGRYIHNFKCPNCGHKFQD